MKIETKFYQAQEVWVMHENRPVKCQVEAIDIRVSIIGIKIIYNVGIRNSARYEESEVFATKEELCKAVFGYENQ